jgi:hypothetical protein
VVVGEVSIVVAIVELLKESGERVFDVFGGICGVNLPKFFNKLGDRVGNTSDSGMREVVYTVVHGIALDFLVYGKWAVFVEMELHGWSVKASLTVDKIAEFGVFDNHFAPEWVAREAKEKITLVCGNFDNDIGPTRDNVVGFDNFVIFKCDRNNSL